MFEKFLKFCNDFISVAFDFASDVADFMTTEIDIAFAGMVGRFTIFEIMFGAGITAYLTFTIIKAVTD